MYTVHFNLEEEFIEESIHDVEPDGVLKVYEGRVCLDELIDVLVLKTTDNFNNITYLSLDDNGVIKLHGTINRYMKKRNL